MLHHSWGDMPSNQGENPKLSVLFALKACEGSPVSQAWAGIEELREQRAAAGERRKKESGNVLNEKWRESSDPLPIPKIRNPLRCRMSNSRHYPRELVS